MVTHRGAVGPRRWPRRLLLGVNIFVAVCLVVSGVAYAYLKWQFSRIDKVDFTCRGGEGVLRNCGDDDAGVAMNVLLVGSDSRKAISPEERKRFGSERQVGGQRSDTIIVLHIDPKAEKAAILSIPRDLAVAIPGSGTTRPQRINTAFERGPDVLVTTIRQSLGIEIDHYAQVDFNGFRGIVRALGGVTLYFPSPARDRVSGLDVSDPGCVELNGDEALAFVRSRNYQYFESGRWRIDPRADLGRIERQQDFIQRVIRKASRAGRNPVTLNSLISTAVENVKIDSAFSTKDIFRLARRFRSFEPDAVEMLSLPTTQARIGGAAVLRLKQPDATHIIERFRGRAAAPQQGTAAPPRVLPGTVRVRVLNGSGTGGQAGSAAQALQRAGFGIAGTGDADSFRYATSLVRYAPGQLPKARALHAYLEGATQLREDASLRGGDLVLVTGRTFAGVRPPPDGAPQQPTQTTAPTPATRPEPKGAPAQPAC